MFSPSILLFFILNAIPIRAFPFGTEELLERVATEGILDAQEQHILMHSNVIGGQKHSLQRRRAPILSTTPILLADLLAQLDTLLWPCKNDRILDGPLIRRLLNESILKWNGPTKNGTTNERRGRKEADGQLAFHQLKTAQLFAKQSAPYSTEQSLPPNSTLTSQPPIQPPFSSANNGGSPAPAFGLHLSCENHSPRWFPIAVFPTIKTHTFLQIRLPQINLDACGHSACLHKHCSYTVHGGIRVFARSCCADQSQTTLTMSPTSPSNDGGEFVVDLCREDWDFRIFFLISAICAIICLLMIAIVIRERRRQQQHDARNWALMEAFFAGGCILYSIPLLGWAQHLPWTCWMAIFGRQIGFVLFYGAVILKIYRNLQEYRVRKAKHVNVRELDLIVYLLFALFIIIYGIFAWSSGAWRRNDLWESEWPQCPVEEFTILFSLCEQFSLLWGIRLCYKARNSSWVERYQFTMALVLEAVVSLVVSAIRYILNETGSRDTLLLIALIQLHLTISVNIAAIVAPKFLISSETSRRAIGNSSGLGSSNRAHPSLAKMRENLINGTIDFQEVPIVDMNPEDIRAELKRVYTQLRMYKLKNTYQDNPHISKRKGGGAKKIQVQTTTTANEPNNKGTSTTGTGPTKLGGTKGSLAAIGPSASSTNIDRRISIPPNAHVNTNSPKDQRGGADSSNQRLWCAGGEMDSNGNRADEFGRNDLTVESAPFNVHLLTTANKMSPQNVPSLAAMDQSIRV